MTLKTLAATTLIAIVTCLFSVIANGSAVYNQYRFFLDSSLQKYSVTIYPVVFHQYPENIQKHVICTSSKSTPIVITGMQSASYTCTQSDPLDIKPYGAELPEASITIEANHQQLKIDDIGYVYYPWEKPIPGIIGIHSAYLLYIDEIGQLNFRRLS